MTKTDEYYILETEVYDRNQRATLRYKLYKFNDKNQMDGFLKKVRGRRSWKITHERISSTELRRRIRRDSRYREIETTLQDMTAEDFSGWVFAV